MVRKKLAALLGGAIALVTLCFPAVQPQAAHAATCNPIYGVGNGNKWSYIAGDGTLHFNSTGTRTSFCVDELAINPNTGTSEYKILLADNSGRCLALNATTGYVDLDGAGSCNLDKSWDIWQQLTVNTGNVDTFAWANYYYTSSGGYPLDCLYDYNQEPAIWTPCDGTSDYYYDTYYWFYWVPSGP